MKKQDFIDAVGSIDDQLIEQCLSIDSAAKLRAAAACLVVLAG